MRGRPEKPLDDRRAPRVRFWRNLRNRTQAELAAVLGMSQANFARIEKGEHQLDFAQAVKLAAALGVGPTDLYTDAPSTVPLLFRVGSRFAEGAPESPALPAPHERVPVPKRLLRPEECFAAEIADASADRLNLPRGTTVFVRERAVLAGGIAPGARVLVGVCGGDGTLAETFVGELAPNALGDLHVMTRSSSRDVPPAIVVRASAAAPGMSLADRQQVFRTAETVDVTPQPGDEAEILGRVEASFVTA